MKSITEKIRIFPSRPQEEEGGMYRPFEFVVNGKYEFNPELTPMQTMCTKELAEIRANRVVHNAIFNESINRLLDIKHAIHVERNFALAVKFIDKLIEDMKG